MLSKKSEKGRKNLAKKIIKEKESKIKILIHELLAFTLYYLMLALRWYTNPSNLSSRTTPMSSLIFIYFFSHYRFVLSPHYELVPPWTSVRYVQTISGNITRGFPQLMPPLISHVCHRFRPDLFLCDHKSILAWAAWQHWLKQKKIKWQRNRNM
jgi:hypothetical protein